jgi:hypothetical protein
MDASSQQASRKICCPRLKGRGRSADRSYCASRISPLSNRWEHVEFHHELAQPAFKLSSAVLGNGTPMRTESKAELSTCAASDRPS